MHTPNKKQMDIEKRITPSLLYSTVLSSLSSLTFGLSLTGMEMINESRQACNITESKIFKSCIKMTDPEWSSVISVICIGALISNLLINYIDCSVKRKIILNNALYFIGTFLIFMMTNYFIVLLGRILIGLGVGITCSVVPYYLSTISPVKIRGILCSFHQFMIVFGVLLGQVLTYYFYNNWRFGISIILIYIILHTFLLLGIRDIQRNENTEDASFNDLISNSAARKSISMVVILHLVQQVSCINGVIYYSNEIMKGADNPRLYSIYVGIVSLVSSLLSLGIIDKFGRKIMLIISMALVTASLFSLALDFEKVFSLFVFIFGFNLGLGPVVWLISGEIFPRDFKRAGATLGVSVNWISNFIIALVFPLILKSLGCKSFAIYGIGTGFVMMYIFAVFRETRGKVAEFQ